MKEFIVSDYRAIVDRLREENGREPESMEIALGGL